MRRACASQHAGVVYVILRRLPVSAFGRLVVFSLIVFLPRHMYMSAMYANDAPVVFFVTLSAYLAIRLLQGADGWVSVLLLAVHRPARAGREARVYGFRVASRRVNWDLPPGCARPRLRRA